MSIESINPEILKFMGAYQQGMQTETRYQLDSNQIIENTEHLLRGDSFNEGLNIWEPGFTYEFRINAPMEFHRTLANLVLNKKLNFDEFNFDKGNPTMGIYKLSIPTYIDFLFKFLNENKEIELTKEDSKQLIQITYSYSIMSHRHMNEKGIKRMMGILKPFMDKNNFLTNYDDETIRRMCIVAGLNIIELLILQGEEFEIRIEDYSNILNGVMMTNIEAAIRRATNKMTFGGMTGMHATVEHIDSSHQQQQMIQQQEQSKWKFWK